MILEENTLVVWAAARKRPSTDSDRPGWLWVGVEHLDRAEAEAEVANFNRPRSWWPPIDPPYFCVRITRHEIIERM